MKQTYSYEQRLINALTFGGSHINSHLKGKAWVGHVPFAYWLVSTIKPKIIVELGTHGGGSFFSFCQSVLDYKLNTKTYAVDTWEGEEHAGFYSNSVYENVSNFNKNNYQNFSTLLKMRFDDALVKFEDRTVDFLHIDGYHSYEAVSNDFNTWYKKLSKNAVVLFHDTNEFKKGFGVHQFWSEKKTQLPNQCFEFKHSHGLGIFFPNCSIAATNFKNELKPNVEKFFNIFTVIGEEIYYRMNGRYSLPKNLQLSVDQLLAIIQNVKIKNPTLTEKIKSVIN